MVSIRRRSTSLLNPSLSINMKMYKMSGRADGGSHSRFCARWTLHLAPHQWKFFSTRVCKVNFKHLHQQLKSQNTLPFRPKIKKVPGEGGTQTLGQLLFGRRVTWEERRENKTPLLVDNTFTLQRPRAVHCKLFGQTKFKFKVRY